MRNSLFFPRWRWWESKDCVYLTLTVHTHTRLMWRVLVQNSLERLSGNINSVVITAGLSGHDGVCTAQLIFHVHAPPVSCVTAIWKGFICNSNVTLCHLHAIWEEAGAEADGRVLIIRPLSICFLWILVCLDHKSHKIQSSEGDLNFTWMKRHISVSFTVYYQWYDVIDWSPNDSNSKWHTPSQTWHISSSMSADLNHLWVA